MSQIRELLSNNMGSRADYERELSVSDRAVVVKPFVRHNFFKNMAELAQTRQTLGAFGSQCRASKGITLEKVARGHSRRSVEPELNREPLEPDSLVHPGYCFHCSLEPSPAADRRDRPQKTGAQQGCLATPIVPINQSS